MDIHTYNQNASTRCDIYSSIRPNGSGYTRMFNTLHAPKDACKPNSKEHTNSCPVFRKVAHTTKLEEGKRRVIRNVITQ